MKLSLKLLGSLFFFALLYGVRVWAAACCGGGFAAPALIVSDDKAQFTGSYTFSRITEDVGADGIWRKRELSQHSEILRLEGAHIFEDRFQVGTSVPVIKRSMGDESSAGLGDVSGTLGYEYLTDWDYSPWRPRGFGFVQLTLPTGRSIHESEESLQLDARGRGFWALGVGTVLTKVIGHWDAHANLEIHRSFDKKYDNGQTSGTLKPGLGGSAVAGGGYSYGPWRAGASVGLNLEEGVDVEGTVNSLGSQQRYASVILTGSYLLNDEWAAMLQYTDQSLLGTPANTSLSQSAALMLQRRWAR